MKSSRGGKTVGTGSRLSLGLPSVFLLCLFFFFAGFFGLALFSQQDDWSAGPQLKPRLRKAVSEEAGKERGFDPLPHGESGDSSFTSIPFQVLSWNPWALYFPNFATAEQCQTIIKKAKAGLQPSILALRKGETAENTKGIRTSSGTFISASEDKTGVLDLIEGKIEKVTMIPRTFGEAFNVLRYETGQRYRAHYDAFNPAEYGPQKSQRLLLSCCIYLMLKKVGRPSFLLSQFVLVLQNGINMDASYDYSKCIGLKVKPRRGDGLLFYSLFPNGTIDATSLHGSCPVIRGEKWVATKWIRNEEQED